MSANRRWSEEELKYIAENCKYKQWEEVRELFNEHFGLSISSSAFHSVKERYRIRNGLDCRFKKGQHPKNHIEKGEHISPATEFKVRHIPNNIKEVGTERITDGYLWVKIDGHRKWKAKHVMIWEEANGPVPKGHAVIFADGDKTNFTLDNLLLVSRAELCVMNHFGLIYEIAEYTKIGKTVSGIHLLIAKRKKELEDNKRQRLESETIKKDSYL